MPADDLTDPAPATTFAHLDATTILDRRITELGIYPAVDPLASTSRILDPRVVGQEHYDVARGVQFILQRYRELQDIIAILGIDELSDEEAHRGPGASCRCSCNAVLRRRRCQEPGRYVSPGCRARLQGDPRRQATTFGQTSTWSAALMMLWPRPKDRAAA